MNTQGTTLRFGEFSKAALGGAIVGAMAIQPTIGLAATGSVTVYAGNAIWYLNTDITFASTSSNWGFSEASLITGGGTLTDAADGILAWHVNAAGGSTTPDDTGGYVSPGGVVSILPSLASLTDSAVAKTITGQPQVIEGLNVSGQIYFSTTRAVARSILVLQNPTGAPISVRVWNANNLGSDSGTVIQTTSSGDSTFDPTDNWVISSQNEPPTNDPIMTFAWQGPGAAVTRTDSSSPFAAGNDNPNEYYDITVPAGATRRLMVFVQMSDSTANATTDAARFNSAAALRATDYLSGLSTTELSEIVNWDLSAATASAAPIPTLGEWATVLLSSLLALFGISRLGRRRDDARIS